MAETLSEVMNAALDAGGDTGTPTPTAPPANTSPGSGANLAPGPAPETAPAAETPAPPAAEPEGEQPFTWGQVPPELMPLAKQFQADYTRKSQELAEQRKAIEGVDPNALQWMNQVRGLAATNPEIAAQMLRQEAERLAQQTQANQPPADPYQQQQWATDTERFLADRVQQMERVVRDQEQSRARAEIDRQFGDLEKEIGKPVPYDERAKVAQFCIANQIANPQWGWKLMNWEKSVQMGRDQAAGVVQTKQQMAGPPAGVANREAPSTREPTSVREALEMALSEAE